VNFSVFLLFQVDCCCYLCCLVALDTINTLVVAGMILVGAAFEEVIYIDVAIVYALLSYIGTLYVAKYLEGGPKE